MSWWVSCLLAVLILEFHRMYIRCSPFVYRTYTILIPCIKSESQCKPKFVVTVLGSPLRFWYSKTTTVTLRWHSDVYTVIVWYWSGFFPLKESNFDVIQEATDVKMSKFCNFYTGRVRNSLCDAAFNNIHENPPHPRLERKRNCDFFIYVDIVQ